jgi:uncharacterized protein YehS (DUF1456 family)
MYYLAAQILLLRNDLDQTETLIEKNLGRTQSQGTKKIERCFLRLLGEVKIRRNESENAAEIIRNTANGLSDRKLRVAFLTADPIREILSKAESSLA